MEKVKERGKSYAIHKAKDKLNDYYGSAMLNVVQFDGHDIQCAYVDGYFQAEQDLKMKAVDLDKACKWLEENAGSYLLYPFCEYDKGSLIEDFRKAMGL